MSLDMMFVRRFLEDGKPAALQEIGITPDMLFDDGKLSLLFSIDCVLKYGKMPDIQTVEIQLGKKITVCAPEELKFYADLIKKRFVANKISPKIEAAINALKNNDTDAAVEFLSTGVGEARAVQKSGADSAIIDYCGDASNRLEEYQRVKALGGEIDGYPLPWPTLNKLTRGIHPGELWFIVARMKTGKTFLLSAITKALFEARVKVLVISMEMSLKLMTRRLDAMIGKFSYGDFVKSELGTDSEVKYAKFLSELETDNNPPLWITGRGRVTTTQDVEMLIEELKPDIVLIDGVYFLSAPGVAAGGSKYDRVSAVVDILQRMSQEKNIPVIATTQFNRTVKKSKLKAGAENIGFSYEIGQNAHLVLGMFQDEDMKASGKMVVSVMEHREGDTLSLLVNWDFTLMNHTDEIGIVHGDDLEEDDKSETIVY